MAIRSKEYEAVAVLSDAAAGVDQDVIANQRKLNRTAGADVAIPANPDIGPDHRSRADHRPSADFDVGTDHRQGIDHDSILQMRRRIDHGGSCDAGAAEPGLRAKDTAVELARNFDEFAERLGCPQHGNVGRNAGLETLADQTRPGLR